MSIRYHPSGGLACIQEEALPLVPDGFPNKDYLDVLFGITEVAYLSSQPTKDWPSKMALVKDGTEQRIMGAQVPVWVSIDTDKYPHVRQLLSDKNKLIKIIEERLTK